MKTLVLTSPFTTGPDVVLAQAHLKRANIFSADYLQGPQDGVFGEGTARACIRAKYWLGYSTPSQDPIYGDQLDGYLTGRKPLGPIMRLRRQRRLAALQEIPARVKALNLARTQIGITELPPGSNKVKYSEWYGMQGPWCAMFVSWCLDRAGSSFHYAYVPYVVNDARAGRNGLAVVPYWDAQAGDLACYDWDGGVADHIGFLEKKVPGANAFYAIEGNTSVGNDSNGGEVMRRYRKLSQVEAFVRVSK